MKPLFEVGEEVVWLKSTGPILAVVLSMDYGEKEHWKTGEIISGWHYVIDRETKSYYIAEIFLRKRPKGMGKKATEWMADFKKRNSCYENV